MCGYTTSKAGVGEHFFANVTDEEMEELLAHNKYCEENNVYEEFEISALTDFELNDTWDGCWGDIRVWKTDWTEEQRQELKEKIEDSPDWWDCLMEHGFDPHDVRNLHLWCNQY